MGLKHRLLVLKLSVSLMAISGCSVGPEYEAPTMNLPASYSPLGVDASKTDARANWWKAFNDPVLDALIVRALRDNVELNQARRRVEEAEALALAAVPMADVNGRVEAQIGSDDLGGDRVLASLTPFATLFGAQRYRSKAAQARVEAARAQRDNANLILLSNLTTAYVDLRFVQEQLVLKQRERRTWARTLRDIRTLENSGQATKLDVTQVRAEIAQTEVAIRNLLTEIVRQKNRISTLLGYPAHFSKLDLGYNGKQPLPAHEVNVGVPADLIVNRPDIRQAERNYRATVAEIGAAESLRYPSLTLSGTISVRNDLSPNSGGLGAVGLNIPVFDQGGRKANVAAHELKAQTAQLEWRQRVLLAVEEVETLLVALSNSKHAHSAALRARSLNKNAVSLARRLFEVGELTVIEFLALQRESIDAQLALTQNRRQLASYYVALQIATGAGSSLPLVPETH
ncbi:efflux transporter outer membrane subunit [Rhodobacteraceae bacterium D3-12]|nr:efflux transporter outer membrane subunit [Rhodobacteraceae bacterium D3-12]